MKFIIEYWNSNLGKYIPLWEGNTYSMAKTMMNKGYHVKFTRRMKVVDERILYKAKAGKYMDDSEDITRQSKLSKKPKEV